MSDKKNIYQKLMVIQRAVNGLGKNETTKSQYNPKGYEYVNGDKVISVIKPLMNQEGLLLIPEIISIENQLVTYTVGQNNKEKTEVLSKVIQRYTWVDSDTREKHSCEWGANGQNDFEKGLGSALTYGERYFLLKFFHIATDGDDVDSPDRKNTNEFKPVSEQEKQKAKEPVDYSEKIKHMADSKSLAAFWKTLSPENKAFNLETKDKMKDYLTKKENKNAGA